MNSKIHKFVNTLESMDSSSPIIKSTIEATKIIFESEENSAFGPGGKYRDVFISGVKAYKDGDIEKATELWSQILSEVTGKDKLRIASYLKNAYQKIEGLSQEEKSQLVKKMNKIIYELEGSV